MRYRRERQERRQSRRGCLIGLVALVWIVLLAMLGYRFLLRDQVSQQIGQQIGEQIGEQIAPSPVAGQIDQGVDAALPTVVAGLPTGEIRVNETDANAYLAANISSMRRIDGATVRFVPGQVQLDIQAAGTTSTATMGVAVQDGRVIAVDPQLDGLLGQVISADQLAATLEQRFNDQLAAQGRRISEVRVEQGELVLVVQ